eukprot:6946609-Lingulodinium_polyedra.AAC.1
MLPRLGASLSGSSDCRRPTHMTGCCSSSALAEVSAVHAMNLERGSKLLFTNKSLLFGLRVGCARNW